MPKAAEFLKIHELADAAGMDAVAGLPDQVVCGFAWVKITPGTSGFAKWAVKNQIARKSFTGGVDVWVSKFGQSILKKEAYADAYAAVLAQYGLQAYSGSRLD